MLLTPEDLQRVASRTLSHYDEHAQSYWEGTRDHDVSQNVDALLQSIEAPPPFELLDLGCGPGRDLKTFTALGHRATGLEGSAQLAALARKNSGREVLEQNLLTLELPSSHFDGVFANAVLFHVPTQELPRILRELWTTLKAWGRAVHLESQRRRSGGLEWRPLWRIPRLADLARLRVRCRIPGAEPLLSSEGLATRPTALAGQCVAQADVLTPCLRRADRDCRLAASPDSRRHSVLIGSEHPESSMQSVEVRTSRNMATVQVNPELPEITPAQGLTGWRREFCVELLGDGSARIFVRAVEKSSFKAAELQRAILFHRLDSRVRDLEGCVQAIRPDLDRLIDTARRTRPDKENLFVSLEYDRAAWERVQQGIDRWAKR